MYSRTACVRLVSKVFGEPVGLQLKESNQTTGKVEEVVETLTNREREVLRLRFGLEDGHYRTLQAVGGHFGFTRERIRQIETKALRQLRDPYRSKKLKDLLE